MNFTISLVLLFNFVALYLGDLGYPGYLFFSGVDAAICLWGYAVFLFRPEKSNLAVFCMTTLLAFYAVSTLSTELKALSNHGRSVAELEFYRQYALNYALAVVNLSAFVFMLLGRYNYPLVIHGDKFRRECLVFLYMLCIFAMYAFVSGQIKYAGVITIDETRSNKISAFASITVLALPALPAVLLREAMLATKKWEKTLCLWLSVFCMFAVFTMGRRLLMGSLLLGLFVWEAYVAPTLRINMVKKYLYYAVLGLFASFGYKLYYAMRLVGWMHPDAELYDQLMMGLDFMTSNGSELAAQLAENAEFRAYIIGYLSEIAEAVSKGRVTDGAAFWENLLIAIPSLFINKDGLESGEYVVTRFLAMWDTDYPSSFLSYGYADFGLLGVVLYTCFDYFSIYWFLRVIGWLNLGTASLFFILFALTSFQQIEGEFVYAVFLREGAILLILFLVIKHLGVLDVRKNA
ncbi:hypothetical protein F6R98_04915 [Candidatus Methylospira mobilis]|uniref:Oligosaccharide repeat unit polymerase n=1 Tax=Candidatus Methylospira mobilis TaxID=1808979 RepID=A0A5Q0BEW3_9GAMM|nr:hypothetical protein [Candidatus Methylospira mobilis]QFY42049.1 hypothetical protein F6R98_04915 [Candidatus Methylospira mobilis]